MGQVCLHTVKTSARDRKKCRKSKKGAEVGYDSRGRKMVDMGKGGESKAERNTKYRNINKGGSIEVLYCIYYTVESHWDPVR